MQYTLIYALFSFPFLFLFSRANVTEAWKNKNIAAENTPLFSQKEKHSRLTVFSILENPSASEKTILVKNNLAICVISQILYFFNIY